MNNETPTKCICNKGFSGYSSVVARSNFSVGGQEAEPQSLTSHTLKRSQLSKLIMQMKFLICFLILSAAPIYLYSQNQAETDTSVMLYPTITKEFFQKKTYRNKNTKTEGKISQRQFSSDYDLQFMVGMWKSYYRNGQLKDSIYYDINSQIVGTTKSFYKNGFLRRITDFDTLAHFKYKNNVVLSQVIVKHDGYYKKVYSKHKKDLLLNEGLIMNYRKTGQWKYYNDSGKLTKEVFYEDGHVKTKHIYK